MPRVTKAQKEAGKTAKPKAKKGFNVGPSRAGAGRDAYLGKAKKIKADLIMRAKVKKQYAKVLKEEGLDSKRMGDGSRRRGLGDDGKDGRGNVVQDKSDSDSEDEEEAAESSNTANLITASGKSRALSLSPPPPPPPTATRSAVEKKGSGKGKGRMDAEKSLENGKEKEPEVGSEKEAVSFRTMKKEAFSKYHPRKTASTHQTHQNLGGNGGRGGGRGQPNMGARMGVLLEQIKRDRT
ncbi:hypothetical protein P7C73_g2007, partial [Tremellales sp. Uapishka_1]